MESLLALCVVYDGYYWAMHKDADPGAVEILRNQYVNNKESQGKLPPRNVDFGSVIITFDTVEDFIDQLIVEDGNIEVYRWTYKKNGVEYLLKGMRFKNPAEYNVVVYD